MFVFRKNIFFKAIAPRESVGDDVDFARNEVNVRIVLLNAVEPTNDAIWSGIICENVEMVSMNV